MFGREGCDSCGEMEWYGPAIEAVVLFSLAGFYIFRTGSLATMPCADRVPG